jgi:DNA invertase Pin-like site-specific DNA recombinase
MDKDTYRVGIYTRLSIDDGTNEESVSIDTQKKILTDFVVKKGWQITKVYVDDGYSGGNFERPDFQRMIQDIENKVIDCVVTKDLSRLGRNYLDCGYYLEIFFPEHQVRYIAVNDGVDTISNSSMDITPFKNILNEMYVKDISVKVSSARKARLQDGKFMATTAPIGYLKDPQNHNHLIIDEEIAPIIKEIFEMYNKGKGTHFITNYLENKKILRPSEYLLRKGLIKKVGKRNKSIYYWSNKTILDILSNPVYKGAVVGNKTKKVSPKSKKLIKIPQEQWIIIEDMHEPIISKELFDNVQRIRANHKARYECNADEERYKNIFSRFLRCPNDKNIICRKIDTKGDSVDIANRKYCCSDKCPHKTQNCKSIYIRAEKLYNIVLNDINNYTNDFYNNKDNYSILEQKLEEMTNQNTKIYENEKNKLQNRLNELNQLITSSYEDKVFKRITEDTFIIIMNKYESEQKEIKDKLEKVIDNLETTKRNNKNAISFSKLLKEFRGTSKLTISTISNLIDKITIFPSEIYINEDGQKEKRQKIEICYRYVGCLNPTTIKFDTINYKTRYKDKVCKLCGKTFSPITSTQKYCDDCKERATKLKRQQRYREKIKAQGGNNGYSEKVCQLCGKTYKPNSSSQKYCSDCREEGRTILKNQWYIKKKEIYQNKKKQKQSA